MTFEKNNKLGFVPENDIPLDTLPLSIKLRQGVRVKVRSIPDWQDKLRDLIEDWAKDESKQDDF